MLKLTNMAVVIASAMVLTACQANQTRSDADTTDESRGSVNVAAPELTVQKIPAHSESAPLSGTEDIILAKNPSAPKVSKVPNPVNSVSSDPRMAYAANLIYHSSAAKQIQGSDNQQAHSLYQEAQVLYQKANKQDSSEKTRSLLDQALQKMFIAVKYSEPEEVRIQKSRNDYARKKDSVKALLDAHDRVSKDKNKLTQGKKMHTQVSQLLTQADTLYQQGSYSQGKGILDGALNIVKTSIEQMRGGDTLVKDLKFDSIKDEYVYEIDRNDTHLMLIKVLLSEKRKKSPDLDKKVKDALDIAGQYRKKAQQLAINNDYQVAVKWLEKSTLELMKVIRRGGIYIPGA